MPEDFDLGPPFDDEVDGDDRLDFEDSDTGDWDAADFCCHGSLDFDCEEKCKTCGHKCSDHCPTFGCEVEGCKCCEFMEPSE